MSIHSITLYCLAIWTAGFSFGSIMPEAPIKNKAEPEFWEMVKNSQGVQTYYRWIKKEDGTPYRERKGELLVECSVQEAVSLISDAGSTKKWMSGINEIYYLKQISKTEWYTYTLFSIPWPFSKRDLVSHYKVITDPAKKSVRIVITCYDKYIPLREGITRLTDYRAIWTITQREENYTLISLNMASSAPPAFPRYIQDPVIERMFHNNMIRLKETLQE